jgi:hypothetical protein
MSKNNFEGSGTYFKTTELIINTKIFLKHLVRHSLLKPRV